VSGTDRAACRATACSKCRKNIASGVRFRKAMGKFYHMECFVCAHCKCVLPQVRQSISLVQSRSQSRS